MSCHTLGGEWKGEVLCNSTIFGQLACLFLSCVVCHNGPFNGCLEYFPSMSSYTFPSLLPLLPSPSPSFSLSFLLPLLPSPSPSFSLSFLLPLLPSPSPPSPPPQFLLYKEEWFQVTLSSLVVFPEVSTDSNVPTIPVVRNCFVVILVLK